MHCNYHRNVLFVRNTSLIKKGLRLRNFETPERRFVRNTSLIKKGLRPSIFRLWPLYSYVRNTSLIKKGLRHYLHSGVMEQVP